MKRLIQLLTVAVILLVLPLPPAAIAGKIRMVSIVPDKINMRSGPGEQYAVLWELRQGYPLRVIGSKGKWLKVIDFEQDVGWVYEPLVGKTAHLVVKGNKKKRINIRSGPGTKYRIIGQADYGVVFKTIERGKGWVKVMHDNGLTGWVKRSLLWGW